MQAAQRTSCYRTANVAASGSVCILASSHLIMWKRAENPRAPTQDVTQAPRLQCVVATATISSISEPDTTTRVLRRLVHALDLSLLTELSSA